MTSASPAAASRARFEDEPETRISHMLAATLPAQLAMALEVDVLGNGGPTQRANTLFQLPK